LQIGCKRHGGKIVLSMTRHFQCGDEGCNWLMNDSAKGDTMKLLSFDIEISDVFNKGPKEDIEKYAPFHISVAATAVYEGEEKVWYSEENGNPALNMTKQRAQELLEYLEEMQKQGYMVCAWNGLKFDLKWIGHNADNMALAARIALKSYDPMFQFFNQRGFFIGMGKAAEAMGISQMKLMASEAAPVQWQAGNHQEVMDYCLGDCQMTNKIVHAIQKRKKVQWITAAGQNKTESMVRLKTVEEVIQDPPPDQSWMRGDFKPTPKRTFYKWVQEALG
jgi:hypothetical protein